MIASRVPSDYTGVHAMMKQTAQSDPRQYPILVTKEDFDRHPHLIPALVPIPPPLVHPLNRMLQSLFDTTPTGILFRGIEALLVAIDEEDNRGIDSAMETMMDGWLARKREAVAPMKW